VPWGTGILQEIDQDQKSGDKICLPPAFLEQMVKQSKKSGVLGMGLRLGG
jgi:hypothetical protein